ncbi:hypothetical protein MA16_Dca019075 [Dendrobium catenatum]|uniref:Uncharacterized protein n=1 Tax=Dendrobium catenatum TaxID=906689 RepID=A0A2I0VUA6_9ASPA|nr:hypothetical protein MA16_Dca019075 [Dendrobium catenatum]
MGESLRIRGDRKGTLSAWVGLCELEGEESMDVRPSSWIPEPERESKRASFP